jgi:glycosyltransferase involved in cell wall biosynthesis
MADLDIFCHTSITPEPFGLVIIEAMAMGCPVIAARAGGPTEIVENAISGMLTPPGDAAALAAAIRGLLANPDRRALLAAAGRARVEAVYSRAAFEARLRALSEEALAGRRSD